MDRARKCIYAKLFSHVRLCDPVRTWQKHSSGLPFPPPGHLPDPGIETAPHPSCLLHLQADSLPTEEAPTNIDIAHQPHGYRAEQTILSYFHLQLPASLTKHQISKLHHHRRPSVTLSHFLFPAFPSFSKIICRLKFS